MPFAVQNGCCVFCLLLCPIVMDHFHCSVDWSRVVNWWFNDSFVIYLHVDTFAKNKENCRHI